MLIKAEYPILERDTDPIAIVKPDRKDLGKFPGLGVLAFLGDTVDEYAKEAGLLTLGEFESITKTFPVYKVVYKGVDMCLCQAPCGAAPATQILEYLIAYGCRTVIACGSCGALEDPAEGEILIPTEALRDEGTSYHYIEPSRAIRLDPSVIAAIERACSVLSLPYELCKTWTTDGFYRETKDMVTYRKQEGCQVVEMECSALAAYSQFPGASFGQILLTADTLANLETYDERDWGKSAFQKVLRLALEAGRQAMAPVQILWRRRSFQRNAPVVIGAKGTWTPRAQFDAA